jgi:hypothetical protein
MSEISLLRSFHIHLLSTACCILSSCLARIVSLVFHAFERYVQRCRRNLICRNRVAQRLPISGLLSYAMMQGDLSKRTGDEVIELYSFVYLYRHASIVVSLSRVRGLDSLFCACATMSRVRCGAYSDPNAA